MNCTLEIVSTETLVLKGASRLAHISDAEVEPFEFCR